MSEDRVIGMLRALRSAHGSAWCRLVCIARELSTYASSTRILGLDQLVDESKVRREVPQRSTATTRHGRGSCWYRHGVWGSLLLLPLSRACLVCLSVYSGPTMRCCHV